MGALAALVWLVPFQLGGPWSRNLLTDIGTYRRVADAIAGGAVPYRDVDVEYPPLATALFWLADLLPGSYEHAFSALMMASLVLTAVAVTATAQALGLSGLRAALAGGVVACSPLLLGNLVETRFDLALAAAVAWTLYAAVTGRFRLMWVLLAVAVLLKLVPLALLPLLAVWHAHRRGVGPAARGVALSLATVAVVVVPFAAMSPSGTWRIVAYHMDRPPQIESMPADYMLVLHWLAEVPLRVESSFGSQGLAGDGPATIAAIGTGLLVVLVVGIAVSTALALARAREGLDARLLVAGVAATTVALLVTGKVLSPQFTVWLLPACLLVGGRYGRMAIPATAAVLVVTQLYFPRRYWDLVALNDLPIALLTLRNALLVALLAMVWPRPSLAAPPPPARLISRAPDAPAASGPDRAVPARYLTD
jgi:hypothetical protein